MTYFLQQGWNGISLGIALALFAMGFSLVLANLKVFNIAYEASFVWGAVALYYLVSRFGLPLYAAWPLAMLVAAAVNVAIYYTAVRHLEKRKDRELAGFVSTLGALAVLNGGVDHLLNGDTYTLPGHILPAAHWHLGGIVFTSDQLLMAGTAAVAFTVVWYAVERTQFGRAIQAVAHDRPTAGLLGINVRRVTVAVFLVAGLMAGAAAVPISISINTINSSVADDYVILAMAIMVIGGFGSLLGTLLGGLATGVISSLTAAYLTTSYEYVVIFAILMLFLIFRPTGLFGEVDTSRV